MALAEKSTLRQCRWSNIAFALFCLSFLGAISDRYWDAVCLSAAAALFFCPFTYRLLVDSAPALFMKRGSRCLAFFVFLSLLGGMIDTHENSKIDGELKISKAQIIAELRHLRAQKKWDDLIDRGRPYEDRDHDVKRLVDIAWEEKEKIVPPAPVNDEPTAESDDSSATKVEGGLLALRIIGILGRVLARH